MPPCGTGDSQLLITSHIILNAKKLTFDNFVQHRGGPTFHTKGHILKKFESEGRTDWKSKKRSARPQMSVFYRKSVKSKKRS